MGKCVKCGRETKNQYECYLADVVYNSGTPTYSNFDHHQDFVCNLCICGKGAIYYLIIFIILLPISIGVLNYGFIEKDKAIFYIGVSLGLGSIIAILTTIRSVIKRNTDNRMGENHHEEFNGEKTLGAHLISKEPQPENPQPNRHRRCFSPMEYANLNK